MKQRLDTILVERGLVTGRDRAKAAIAAGWVYIGGQRAVKAGAQYPAEVEIDFRGEDMKYVSRGGYKLERAVSVFEIVLVHKICMDIGASTGGFTDCMLQNGAKQVYAVDVGLGQLDQRLLSDPRVVDLEQTNIRYLEPDAIDTQLDFISVDVSFISLQLVLPVAVRLLKSGGEMVCLVKPQFEAGREKVGKGGVVRGKGTHRDVLRNVLRYARETGFLIAGLEYSPIKGPKGNIEYLLYLKTDMEERITEEETAIADVVERAHRVLNQE